MSKFFNDAIEAQVFYRYLFEKDPYLKAQLFRLLTEMIRRPKPSADVRELEAAVARIRAGGSPNEAVLRLMETTANAYLYFVAAFERETDEAVRRRLAQQIIRYRAYPQAMQALE